MAVSYVQYPARPFQSAVGRSPYRPAIDFTAQPHAKKLKDEAVQLYQYLGPLQAATLFGVGAAGSLAFRWFVKGLMLKPIQKEIKAVAKKTTLTYSEGLPAIIKFLLDYPQLKDRILAYGGAVSLGYGLLSLAQGWQEEMVRREETCIRANLLQQLTATFRKGIQMKLQAENGLRAQAIDQLRTVLKQSGLNPDDYLRPNQFIPSVSSTLSYSNDPRTLSRPMPAIACRFGMMPNTDTQADSPPMTPSPNQLSGFKTAMVLGGMLAGLLVQGLFLLRHQPSQESTMGIQFFIKDFEAMFLDKDRRPLVLTLGLSALAKAGKLAIDGYREIGVTRKNADTELAYQKFLQMDLDPKNRQAAEEVAWENRLNRFKQTLPYNLHNPVWIRQSIEVALEDIGRSSVPPYMPSTQPVSLTPARG